MGAGALGRPVSIAVVEDQKVVVDGVRAWVAADPDGRVTVAAAGASVAEVLAGPGRGADVLVLSEATMTEIDEPAKQQPDREMAAL